MRTGWAFVYLFVAFSGVLSDGPDELFSKASCELTVDLLKAQMKQTEGNFVISPNNVGLLLAALQQGAKENTLKQLESALRLTPEQAKNGFNTLLKSLQGEKKNVTLEWGNRGYIKQGFGVADGYNTRIRENFGVDVQELNFAKPSTQEAANVMNAWVKDVTHDHIKNLIAPDGLSPDTVLVLLNAVYFKGFWRNTLQDSLTKEGDFHLTRETDVKVPYMHQKILTHYVDEPDLKWKWIQLPYKDRQFSMLFLLPDEWHGMSRAMEKLTGQVLKDIIYDSTTENVELQIPKFKMEGKVELSQTLKELGVTDVFSDAANLQGITPNGHLKVSRVVQQVNVEVDEQGSTGGLSGSFTPRPAPTRFYGSHAFKVDRPFLFFLLDKKNNVPLFAGRIVDPR